MGFWAVFLVSLSVAWVLTPQFRRLAGFTGAVDVPSFRKMHATPTPLLGGVAIYAAILCGWLASVCLLPSLSARPLPVVFAMATALMVVGVLDDCYDLGWWLKIILQFAAAWMLWSRGVRVDLSWLPGWANLALTLLWIVGITNAVNFLDNMNGLAAGLCAISAGYFALLGLANRLLPVAGVSVAVAGACLGFLRFNYRQASIFMGDAGSLLLGLLMAVLGLLLRFPARTNWVTWMTPVMVMLVPVFDMTLVFVSRLCAGRNPLATPGKDHLSHRLVRLGLTPVQAVDSIYALAACCGLAGSVAVRLPLKWAYLLGGLLLAFFTVGIVLLTIRVPVTYPPRRTEP